MKRSETVIAISGRRRNIKKMAAAAVMMKKESHGD